VSGIADGNADQHDDRSRFLARRPKQTWALNAEEFDPATVGDEPSCRAPLVPQRAPIKTVHLLAIDIFIDIFPCVPCTCRIAASTGTIAPVMMRAAWCRPAIP
jgi:hypothetical protein